MPSRKSRLAEDHPTFDRRSTPRAAQSGAERGGGSLAAGDDLQPRKRRATRDGREALVVYMLPEAIKALKIAALQLDTTASAIVSDAVSTWLRTTAKRQAK